MGRLGAAGPPRRRRRGQPSWAPAPSRCSRPVPGSGTPRSPTPASGPTRFVQAWVRPDAYDAAPARDVVVADPALAAGGLVPLASGGRAAGGRAVSGALARVGAAGATLWVARLAAGCHDHAPRRPPPARVRVRGLVDVAGGTLARVTRCGSTDEPGHHGDGHRGVRADGLDLQAMTRSAPGRTSTTVGASPQRRQRLAVGTRRHRVWSARQLDAAAAQHGHLGEVDVGAGVQHRQVAHERRACSPPRRPPRRAGRRRSRRPGRSACPGRSRPSWRPPPWPRRPRARRRRRRGGSAPGDR